MFLGEEMQAEMIRTTADLIASEPCSIRLIRQEMTRTPSGGVTRSEPVLLPAVERFLSGIVPDSTLAVRDEGEIVRADHVLIGMPDDDMKAKDYFVYASRAFEIIQVIEATQGFETRAWVKEVSPQDLPEIPPEPVAPFSETFTTANGPLNTYNGWEAGPEFAVLDGSLVVVDDAVLTAAVHEVDPACNDFVMTGTFNVAEQGLPPTEDVPSLMTVGGVARYSDVNHRIVWVCMSYFDIDGNSGVERIGTEFNITTSTSFQVYVFADGGPFAPIDLTVDGLEISDGDAMSVQCTINYDTGAISLTYQGHEEIGTIDPAVLASLTGTQAGIVSFRMEAGRQWNTPVSSFSAEVV